MLRQISSVGMIVWELMASVSMAPTTTATCGATPDTKNAKWRLPLVTSPDYVDEWRLYTNSRGLLQLPVPEGSLSLTSWP